MSFFQELISRNKAAFSQVVLGIGLAFLMAGCPQESSEKEKGRQVLSPAPSIRPTVRNGIPHRFNPQQDETSNAIPGLRNFRFRYRRARGFDVQDPHTVYLDLHDRPELQFTLVGGSLFRELSRQALLIAAREELGLSTRDRTLREEFPWSQHPQHWPLSMVTAVTPKFEATTSVIRNRPEKLDIVWTRTFPLDAAAPYESMAQLVEQLSRDEFVTLLKEAGYKGEPNSQDPNAECPENVEQLLSQWNELSQYAALRELHQLLRTSGESPERLAAIARGYAHLGVLTASYYSALHKVFQARALLYAERLWIRAPETPLAHWHRAYVRALIGLPESALGEIELARKASGTSFDAPWCDVLDDYCRGRRSQLAERRTHAEEAPLAAYLYLLTELYRDQPSTLFPALESFINATPDCLRGLNLLTSYRSLGTKSAAAVKITQIVEVTSRHLSEIRDESKKSTDIPELPADASPEEFRKLVDHLKQTGTPENDPLEPSLDAVGQTLREAGFVSAWSYLFYLKSWLGVSITQQSQQLAPFFQGHVYEPGLKVLVASGAQRKQLRTTWTRTIDSEELEPFGIELLAAVINTHPYYNYTAGAIWEHTDYTSPELQAKLNHSHFEPFWPDLLQHLERVSPREPATIALRLRIEPERCQSEMNGWETEFRDDIPIQKALIQAYLKLGDIVSADRCSQRWIQLAPSFESYQQLAELAKLKRDDAAWIKAMETSCKYPVPGLEHSRTLQQLASHYALRHRDAQALQYAERAADSGAGGPIQQAAALHERLGNWEQAEQHYARAARRYDTMAFNWFFWCRQTGQGDAEAAAEVALEYVVSRSGNMTENDKLLTALYYLFTNDPASAEKLILEVTRQRFFAVYGWHLVVLEDELGKTKDRDEMLARLIKLDQSDQLGDYSATTGIARHVRDNLLVEGGQPDFDFLNDQIARLPPGVITIMHYFLGRLLKNHAYADQGNAWLQTAATSPYSDYYFQALARWSLESAGVDVGPPRLFEYQPPVHAATSAEAVVLSSPAPLAGGTFLGGTEKVLTWDTEGGIRSWTANSNSSEEDWGVAGSVLASTSDGARIFVLNSDKNRGQVWKNGASEPDSELPPLGSTITTAAFVPLNSEQLLCGARKYELDEHPSGRLILWDAHKQTQLWDADLGDITPFGIAFSPDENVVCVLGRKGKSAGWAGEFSLKDGHLLRERIVPRHPMMEFAGAASIPRAATRSDRGEILLWDLKTLQTQEAVWPSGKPAAIDMSPDGEALAIGRLDGSLSIYNLRSNTLESHSASHPQAITGLQFSADGQKLLSTSRDHTTRIWKRGNLQKASDLSLIKNRGPVLTWTNPSGTKFVPVPAGEFLMGERDDYQHTGNYHPSDLKRERPQHRVVISRPYYLSQTEMTVAEFREFIDATHYVTEAEKDGRGGKHNVPPVSKTVLVPGLSWKNPGFEQQDDHPVVQLTYKDVQEFCRWLSKRDSAVYRLPTEAEWERACRGGTTSSWSYGNSPYERGQMWGNYADLSLRFHFHQYETALFRSDGYPFTAPVGQFPPNPYGLYDMHGNVFEWCRDSYSEIFYESSPVVDPIGTSENGTHPQRGGGFFYHCDDSRSAHRDHDDADVAWSVVGFRILKEIP